MLKVKLPDSDSSLYSPKIEVDCAAWYFRATTGVIKLDSKMRVKMILTLMMDLLLQMEATLQLASSSSYK
jgi:hypothetical protein